VSLATNREETKKGGSSTGQIIGLICLLVALVALSTVGTLVALDVIQIGDKPAPVESIVDAESVCGQRVRSDYGQKLNAISVDDRSSRYESSSGQYKMFFQLDVYRDSSKLSGVQTFYVNCFVSARQGSIARIDYLEHVCVITLIVKLFAILLMSCF